MGYNFSKKIEVIEPEKDSVIYELEILDDGAVFVLYRYKTIEGDDIEQVKEEICSGDWANNLLPFLKETIKIDETIN